MSPDEWLRWSKRIVRALGVIVSALFMFQGVMRFADPDFADFWDFCHWIGEAFVYILVGLGCCFLEVYGISRKVLTSFFGFAMNRITLAVLYLWMGCYAMGSRTSTEVEQQSAPVDDEGNHGVFFEAEHWIWLRHATGVIAWVVCLANLFISCTSESGDDDEQSFTYSQSSAQKKPTVPPPTLPLASDATTLGRGTPGAVGAGAVVASGVSVAPTTAAVRNPFGDDDAEKGGSSLDEIKLEDQPVPRPSPSGLSPQGGWNTSAGSFGGVR